MRTRSIAAVALLAAQAGCARVVPRAARDARAIAVVAATTAPRISVAREDSPTDVMTYWVGALICPPLAGEAVRETAKLFDDVRRLHALRADAGPELHDHLADAVVAGGRGGIRLVRTDPADDAGCDSATAGPAGESLHVAVVSVAWVPAPGPDALLGLAVAIRGVLRGSGGRCAERTLLVASDVERPLEAWTAGEPRELAAELRRQIEIAAPRLLAELVEGLSQRGAER